MLLEVQQNVLYLHREKMKRMKNLTVKTEIKRKKTMDKNLIGTNAGIVWRAMTGEHSWSFEETEGTYRIVGYGIVDGNRLVGS